jgi:hypothetical protein
MCISKPNIIYQRYFFETYLLSSWVLYFGHRGLFFEKKKDQKNLGSITSAQGWNQNSNLSGAENLIK